MRLNREMLCIIYSPVCIWVLIMSDCCFYVLKTIILLNVSLIICKECLNYFSPQKKQKQKCSEMEVCSVSVRRKRESGVISIIIIYWNMRKNSISLRERHSPGPDSDRSIQNVSRRGKSHRQAGRKWPFYVLCIHVWKNVH